MWTVRRLLFIITKTNILTQNHTFSHAHVPFRYRFSKSHVPITEPIHRAYADIYMETCDFDERLWLSNDPQVQTPAPSRGNIMDLVRRPTPRRSGLTPVSKQNVVAFTPVKRVLDNVQSLKVRFGVSSPFFVFYFSEKGKALYHKHKHIQNIYVK